MVSPLHFILTLLVISANSQTPVPGSQETDAEMHQNQIPPTHKQPPPEEIKEALTKYFFDWDKDLDKLLTAEEVKLWMQSIHDKIMSDNVLRQWGFYQPEKREVHSWQGYDPELKEVLDWDKYEKLTFPPEMLKDKDGKNPEFANFRIMYTRAKRRWDTADTNKDKLLEKEEFKDFMHPEESDLPAVKEILIIEALEDMDKDGSNDVSLDEYMKHVSMLSGSQEKKDPQWNQMQQNHFQTYLDKNKDGSLNKEEIKDWIIPPDDRHEQEGERLVQASDANNDKKLSLDELIKNYEHYYTLLPPDFWSKYAPDQDTTPSHGKHDEF